MYERQRDGSMTGLLDIKEAAALLRVSETSLRRWTNAGRLRCLRVGGRRERRFRREDLEAFLEAAPARAPAASPDTGGHWCGLYTSDLSRLRAAVAFLAAALEQAERGLLVATQDVHRAVLAQLERDRPATRRDLDAGRLMLLAFQDTPAAQLDFWRAQLEAARAEGVARVSAVADVSSAPFGKLVALEVLELEMELDRSIAKRFPVAILCQYDARLLSGLEAAELLQRHDGHFH
jgi:transcriptional repressor of dcmA and dcmR